jgi:branched-subunit amino acid aminotransferase/4-amino-4-deoxychorismate lyase
MAKVCLDGEFVDADSQYLNASNRSFRYGDGLFESIRIIDGKIFNLENHLKRITSGLKILKIQMPLSLTLDRLGEIINELIVHNQVSEGASARLVIYRAGNGAFMPSTMSGKYLIEVNKIDHNYFELNENGLSVDIYDDMHKQLNPLSPYKTCNSLLYILASVTARENGLDDVLLLNETHNIIEATSSNIFIVTNGVLYTPTIEDGCVGGTFRMHLINLAIENNIKVYECVLTPQNLLAAEEIFFTNSIKGIQWVGSYKTKRYYNEITRKLVGLVNQSVFKVEAQEEGLTKESNSAQGYQGT